MPLPFSLTSHIFTSWKKIVSKKQTTRELLISNAFTRLEKMDAEFGSIPEEERVRILSAAASQIVSQIQSGNWTATQVARVYINRAIIAHQRTNCLTEIVFDQALDRANALDEEFKKTGKLVGALHGVPLTFKDQYDIEGFDSTIGYTSFANTPAKKNASLISHLLNHGALLLAKTNVPQTLLAFESSNPIFGRTSNPHPSGSSTPTVNADFSSGGSSGGEGALVAMNGTVIGFGSDYGGSLRHPSNWCGIYTLKGCAGRLSSEGVRSPAPGWDAGVLGPMTRSIDDIELICRLCFGQFQPLTSSSISASPTNQGGQSDPKSESQPDSKSEALPQTLQQQPGEFPLNPSPNLHTGDPVLPIPYRDVELRKVLRFGYYTSDGLVKSSPVCKRAVLETVEALKKAGHECVELTIREGPEALALFAGLTASDGYETALQGAGHDPKERTMFLVLLGPSLPGFIRNTLSWIGVHVLGDKYLPPILKESRKRSVKEVLKLNVRVAELRARLYDEVWTKYDLDGVIAPSLPTPALPHGATTTLSPTTSYAALFSIIDSPVGVVPVTRVDKSLDGLTSEWTSLKSPDSYSKLLESDLYKGMLFGLLGKAPIYDAEKMHGLPVGVQVVGKVWEDEKVVKMMRVVDDALGERAFGRSNLL